MQYLESKSKATNEGLIEKGLLGYLTDLLFRKRRAQQEPTREQQSLVREAVRVTTDSEPAPASFYMYRSLEGDPTHVSIRRDIESQAGEAERWEFCAVHNYGPIRHILRYELIINASGQGVVNGHVRELGIKPLVTGPYGPNETSQLLSFKLLAEGSRVSIQRLAHDAHKLTEVFADYGVDGVDRYLAQARRSHGESRVSVERSVAFESYIHETADEDSQTPYRDAGYSD